VLATQTIEARAQRKDAGKPVRLVVYKREYKAKEKERKGQAATRGVIYTCESREGHVSSASTITSTITAAFCQFRNTKSSQLNLSALARKYNVPIYRLR
jgi:hypothetical protein